MNNVKELVNIIKGFGGKASFKEICEEYQRTNKIVLSSNHKITLAHTLKDNKNKVYFDGTQWVLVENNDTDLNLKNTISKSSTYFGFSFMSAENIEYSNWCEKITDEFKMQFPIEKIEEMTIDDYVISAKGYGNDSSFCRKLRYELKHVCSMGNAWPATFEIYKTKDGKINVSPAIKKEFGEDYDTAFKVVKRRIADLLEAAENKDAKKMNDIPLNSAFKQKLVSVYFLGVYYPSAGKEYVKQSCQRIGVVYNESNIFQSMLDIVEWKNARNDIKDIDNITLMRYIDYLIRMDLSMSSMKITDNQYKKQAEKLLKKNGIQI